MAADGERGRSRALDRPRWGLFLGLAASIVVADQLVKAWIVGPGAFVVGRPVSIVGDLVRITLTHNQGALFGLFQGSAPIFALVSLAVLGIILWYHARAGQSNHRRRFDPDQINGRMGSGCTTLRACLPA